MTSQTFKVFLCSTYSDLVDERSAILKIIRQLQLLHSSMEFFGARPETPLETVLEEVRTSDIIIVIVGYRYGTLVPNRKFSYTELEYREAWKKSKPCLVYFRSENEPILPSKIEKDVSKLKSLEKFRDLLKSRHLFATYQKTDDLSICVAIDLERTIKEIKYQPQPETTDTTLSILDFLHTPSFLCNKDNLILKVNNTFKEILGYSEKQMVGKSLVQFIDYPPDILQSMDTLSAIIDKGHRYADLMFKRYKGESVCFELDIIKYKLNRHIIIQCIARDITERKLSEKALRESEANLKEKSMLLDKLLEEQSLSLKKNRKSKPDDNILDDIMSQAEQAYAAYMDAERQVARAYHENELQVSAAYRRAETNEFKNLDASLTLAENIFFSEYTNNNPQLIQQALDQLHLSIRNALTNYQNHRDKAWLTHRDTINQAWEIYSRISR